MFKCQMTGAISMPGEQMTKKVVLTRKKTYRDSEGKIVGYGTEIVKEIGIRTPEGLINARGSRVTYLKRGLEEGPICWQG